MSEPSRRRVTRSWLAFGVATCVAIPGPGAAQSVVEIRRELDSLVPQLTVATAALDSAKRARTRAPVATVTTITHGHLRLRVDSAIAGMVAEAAAKASASTERLFGARAALASAYIITARFDSVVSHDRRGAVIRLRRHDPHTAWLAPSTVRGPENIERVVAVDEPGETTAALVIALDALASAPLHAALDDDLRLWFRSALPSTPESSGEIENIYVDLTTASTEVSRRCLAGDVRGCAQVLGLEPIADPVVEAYTAAERRRIVQGDAERLRVPAKAAEFDRCVGGGDDAACIARLRDRSPESLGSSYSTTAARRSFARWALERGGDGAYARLHASAGRSLPDRFGIAARMPADALIASWQAHVMSARPAQPSISPLSALATVMWIGVCGALALRSSRWR